MDKSFLGVRELAEKMGISEKTVYRMLTDNQIPFAVKIGGQWRFRINAMEAWLSAQTGPGGGAPPVNQSITVRAALNNGAVLYRIHGANRDEALDELLSALPQTGGFDSRAVKLAVLAQESLASSSLNGIASMRPGKEAPFFVDRSLMIIGFLEHPTDFRALDGRKTEVIILTLPANVVEEAILEIRLRRLLMEPEWIAALKEEPGRKELLQLFSDAENRLLPPTQGNVEDSESMPGVPENVQGQARVSGRRRQ
ncbi:MAG: hypothetical protein Kow0089_15900 [Desulfobulbaceae bacterium]